MGYRQTKALAHRVEMWVLRPLLIISQFTNFVLLKFVIILSSLHPLAVLYVSHGTSGRSPMGYRHTEALTHWAEMLMVGL